MTATFWTAAALAVVLLCTGSAAAATVDVPGMVLQSSVPFAINGAAAGSSVNLTVGTVSREFVAVTGSDVFTIAGASTGWQAWAARVENGSGTDSFSGRVYVDGTVAALATSLSGLSAQVTALSNQLAAVNDTTEEAHEDLDDLATRMNRTLNQVMAALERVTTGAGTLDVNVTEAMRRAAAEVLSSQALGSRQVDDLQTAASSAELEAARAASWATYAALAAAVAALLMIVVGMLLFMQVQRSRQESLVYVLALAAHAGITPESPEFQQAVAALGHTPKGDKPKKEKGDKKEKAAKAPKKSRAERLAEKKKAKALKKKP